MPLIRPQSGESIFSSFQHFTTAILFFFFLDTTIAAQQILNIKVLKMKCPPASIMTTKIPHMEILFSQQGKKSQRHHAHAKDLQLPHQAKQSTKQPDIISMGQQEWSQSSSCYTMHPTLHTSRGSLLLQTRPLVIRLPQETISGVEQKSRKRESAQTTRMRKKKKKVQRLPQTLSLPAQTPQRLFYPPCPSMARPRTVHPACLPYARLLAAEQTSRIIIGQKSRHLSLLSISL